MTTTLTQPLITPAMAEAIKASIGAELAAEPTEPTEPEAPAAEAKPKRAHKPVAAKAEKKAPAKKAPAKAEPKAKAAKAEPTVETWTIEFEGKRLPVQARRGAHKPYTLKEGERFDAKLNSVINRWGLPKRFAPLGEILDANGKVLRKAPKAAPKAKAVKATTEPAAPAQTDQAESAAA